MSNLNLFESTPVARRTDPKSSWDAAVSVENIRDSQEHILNLLRVHGPATDEELAARYHHFHLPRQSPSGLRTRRKELVQLQMVRDSGMRRPTVSGRQAVVWEAS